MNVRTIEAGQRGRKSNNMSIKRRNSRRKKETLLSSKSIAVHHLIRYWCQQLVHFLGLYMPNYLGLPNMVQEELGWKLCIRTF